MPSNEQSGTKSHLQQTCHVPGVSLWNRLGGEGVGRYYRFKIGVLGLGGLGILNPDIFAQ